MTQKTDFQKVIDEIGYATAVYPAIGGYTLGGFKKGVCDLVVLTPPDDDGWFTHPALVLEPVMDRILDGTLTPVEGLIITGNDLGFDENVKFTFSKVKDEDLPHLPHLFKDYPNPVVWRLLNDEDRGQFLQHSTFTQ